MKVPGVVNRLALIGDLQAALTHSKVHGVHVDLAGEGLVFRRFRHVCALVLEQGHADLDFFAAALTD